mmetsp:Transcript_37301/g.73948  ORF Transcript_37301/g.73948 Transcript_37301/m.73948 type:complete len:247 (-) Transcript_37301:155-895(-)
MLTWFKVMSTCSVARPTVQLCLGPAKRCVSTRTPNFSTWKHGCKNGACIGKPMRPLSGTTRHRGSMPWPFVGGPSSSSPWRCIAGSGGVTFGLSMQPCCSRCSSSSFHLAMSSSVTSSSSLLSSISAASGLLSCARLSASCVFSRTRFSRALRSNSSRAASSASASCARCTAFCFASSALRSSVALRCSSAALRCSSAALRCPSTKDCLRVSCGAVPTTDGGGVVEGARRGATGRSACVCLEAGCA